MPSIHSQQLERQTERGGADIEDVALGAAEGEVGGAFGHQYLADQRTVRILAMYAILGTCPDSTPPLSWDTPEKKASWGSRAAVLAFGELGALDGRSASIFC
ncbi:hypothetical protein GCM10010862_05730 [Devosia nitrariae]|uniref:Uncharacterized protein n=1 Tax=Devosia nitrariae TaxID=2071872 RepID=A0ABQ5VZR5_9HYPH|nr:hypothetical protein GCM10010862_05730 [Devosia nitrariae]